MKMTMVEGWPDAIRCSSDSSGKGGSIFIMNEASSSDPGLASSYWQIYSNISCFVLFNSDGTYQGRGGYDDISVECVGKSIKQLYSEGKAFNLISSTTQDDLGTTSIIANWPDAIRCNSYPSGKGGSIFITDFASGNNLGWGHWYRQVYDEEDRFISFNGNGTYLERGGDNSSSAECIGKSIQQLYGEGKAFNFVSAKAQDNLGTTSIVPNWPDAIRCNIDPDDTGGVIYVIHEASSDPKRTSSYWEIQAAGNESSISFNADGTYSSSSSFWIGKCYMKSINQLYSEGKAFNFVATNVNHGMFSKTESFVPMNKADDTGFVAITPNIAWCNSHSLYMGDFNGDGKIDLLCNLNEGENYIMLSNTVDDASFVSMNLTDKSGRMDIGNNHNWCNASFQRLLIGDFNGDKKSDLLCSNNANMDQGRAYAMLSNGTAFYPISSSADGKVDIGINKVFCQIPGRLIIGNFDGAYGDDLLCNHPTLGNMLMVSRVNETSKATIFKSVNEKTMGDVTMGNEQECKVIWCPDPAAKLLSGYFNNDNKTDLLCHLNGSNMIMLSEINSTSNCDFTAVKYDISSPGLSGNIRIPTTDNPDIGLSWCEGSLTLKPADIDGDGLTDLVCNNQGQNKVMFCRFKDSYTTFVSINAAQPYGDGSVDIANHNKWCLSQSLFMGDVNGDSLTDLWCNQNGGVIG